MNQANKNGAQWEERVRCAIQHPNSINVSGRKLYKYLAEQGIDYKDIISSMIIPDEAYIDGVTLYVYEKKYQCTAGSTDEKLQTCDFKIKQFRKIAAALGLEDVQYKYLLNEWFAASKYRDVLRYITTIPGCSAEIIVG